MPASPLPALTATPLDNSPTAAPLASGTPSAAPVQTQSVSFDTADGVSLVGIQYGQGTTAVIFATQSDKKQATWTGMAERVAQAGYMGLTFDFRFWIDGTQRDIDLMNAADLDLLAAIDFAHRQGAQAVVLVGASLGGMAVAKAADAAMPAAVVIIGAPLSDPALRLTVGPQDLQSAAVAKLFVVAENDPTVAAERTQAMYALAAEPKEMISYPARAHGTDLFQSAYADDLRQRLLDFIQANAPPG